MRSGRCPNVRPRGLSNEHHNAFRTAGQTAPMARGRRPRRTPKGRQVDPRALDEVRALLGERVAPARSADRASASDPGPLRPSRRRASRRAGAGDEARAHRGLRGRDLLRPFRCGEGGRDAAARRHGAGLRFALLRDGGRRAAVCAICRRRLGRDVRVVRAPCMGACDRAPVCAVGHVQVMQRDDRAAWRRRPRRHAHAHAYPTPERTSRPIRATAATRCSRPASPARARATTSSRS